MIRFNIFDISRRRIVVLLSIAVLFAFAIWFVNNKSGYTHVWQRFYTEREIGTFFCENTYMDKVVRQPMNTFSNFVYLWVGLVILRRGVKDRKKKNRYNIISANPHYSLLLGIIMLYIFCASVFFHSSLIHVASELDFSAVYALTIYPLMYFSHRVWLMKLGLPSNTKHAKSTFTMIALGILAYTALTFFLVEGIRNYVVLAFIFGIITFGALVERQAPGNTNHRYLLTCIASILFAVMWFAFDIFKLMCNPDSLIQPHSLWHLFSGIATFYFYMYIRSEKSVYVITQMNT